MQNIKFDKTGASEFSKTLHLRVNDYFKTSNKNKHGDRSMVVKTIFMLATFFIPLGFIGSGLVTSPLLLFGLYILSGMGMAGIGMGVMHDAIHGSYSKSPLINKYLGYTMNLIGANANVWRIQHNVLHHTYTNIPEHDEDLDAGRILRFSKHADWKKYHKFQHLYSVFLYGLLTFNWAITTDFQQMYRYTKRKLSYGKFPNPVINWTKLLVTKIMYIAIWIAIPIIFTEIAWYQVLIGFFVMHYVAGLILSIVFQLAHIIDHADTPVPNEQGDMKNTWAIHQLFTTVNFGTKNRIINWFTGGLNHQVEHHIFPNISHVHYTKIAKIVKQTAKEFELPYHEYKTTRKAIISHFKHLKTLGQKPNLQY